ncbi:hypothetical protein [Streptomyces sp. NPDC018584]|uniref:hypothetical protein n=1 Tax=unclassified Streptomyces TaxID=2593676 RepID=UPI0037A47A30
MDMIKPAGIPRFIGDWEQLAKDVSGLRSDAIGIRNGGADVHSRFQMLGAYYTAPEADDLFATTQPVMDEADTFAAHLETVADALDTFAAEARPLAEKLTSLREDAFKFVESVEGDDDWTDDGDKVKRNNELWADVIAAKSAFEAAERRAAGKISAIVGGPKYIEDDGSHKATEQTVMYGYDADVLKQAEELPWGSPVSETTAPGDFKGHLKNFLYDGFAVDGAGATLKGLGALVGIGGSAKEAWGHLGDAAMGTGYYLVTPLDWAMDQTMFADEDTETMKRQKAAAREFGKAMVAWDQWEEHPVQAAGTTTFNVLTLGAGPLGALARGGSVAGKAGLGAKAAGIGAKIGTYADPLSAGLTVGGKAVSKLPTVAEVTSRIRAGAGATANIERVHSTLEFEGTRVRVEDGEFIRLDAEGNPVRDAAPQEKAAADRTTPEEVTPRREAGLVSTGARLPGAAAHTGENLPPRNQGRPSGHEGPGSTSATGRDIAEGAERPRNNHGPDVPGRPSSRDVHPASSTRHGGAAIDAHPGRSTTGGVDDVNWADSADHSSSASSDGDVSGNHADAADEATVPHGEGEAPASPVGSNADLHQAGGSLRPRDDGTVRAYDRTETWASNAYESFRTADDVDAMTKSLRDATRLNGTRGFSRDEIIAIKKHIFEEEHPLASIDGKEIVISRYAPDPNMAEAWIRLRAGRYTDSDLLLLEHELAEHQYYVANPGAPYSDAHAAANKIANWEASDITPPTREDYNAPWE